MLNRNQTAYNIVAKVINSVRNYPKMSLLVTVIGCGIVATSYLHIKNKYEKNLFKFASKNLAVKALPTNSITPLELLPEIYKNMDSSTWPVGYPVPIHGLAYVKLLYWGFDDKEHVGALIVNKELAKDVLEIFLELYKNKFPIEQMRPIYEFKNDDDASMEANNSSAFNCREVTGQPKIFSQHSYGRAIDVNPRINPYAKESKNLVLPKGSREFVDRSIPERGKITRESLIYTLFTTRGWDWGGNWKDLQDFQHFEKRENGQKRDPNGYKPSVTK